MAKQQNELETNCVEWITYVNDNVLSALCDIHSMRDITVADGNDESELSVSAPSQSGGHATAVHVLVQRKINWTDNCNPNVLGSVQLRPW